jgi:hypothetical protein
MAKRGPAGKASSDPSPALAPAAGKPSSLVDTRVIYCGDGDGTGLEQLAKLPGACVDLVGTMSRRVGVDPPFNSNRNYEVFWGETKEKRAFEDRLASTQAYIDYMRPRCVELGSRPEENRELLFPLRFASPLVARHSTG